MVAIDWSAVPMAVLLLAGAQAVWTVDHDGVNVIARDVGHAGLGAPSVAGLSRRQLGRRSPANLASAASLARQRSRSPVDGLAYSDPINDDEKARQQHLKKQGTMMEVDRDSAYRKQRLQGHFERQGARPPEPKSKLSVQTPEDIAKSQKALKWNTAARTMTMTRNTERGDTSIPSALKQQQRQPADGKPPSKPKKSVHFKLEGAA